MNSQLGSLRRFLSKATPPVPRAGRHVSLIASGKGGTGTSSVAALLALSAAASGQRTLLVDASESIGTLHLLLGVEAGPGIGALRGGEIGPRDLMVPVTDRLQLITTTSGEFDTALPLGVVERQTLLRRIADLYSEFEQVIIDAGSRLESVLAVAAAGAGALIAVSGSDRLSLTATHALAKACESRLSGLPLRVLFNRCDEEAARAAYDVLRQGTAHFLDLRIGYAGAVPEDAFFGKAVESGTGLGEAMTAAGLEPAVRDAADRIFGEPPAGVRQARTAEVAQMKG